MSHVPLTGEANELPVTSVAIIPRHILRVLGRIGATVARMAKAKARQRTTDIDIDIELHLLLPRVNAFGTAFVSNFALVCAMWPQKAYAGAGPPPA